MERTNILKLVLFVVFLVLHGRGFSLPMPPLAPRPLCASQFALVNHACSLLPFTPGPPPSPPSPPSPEPSPPSPPSPGGHSRGRGRRRNGRHRRHRQRETPIQQECCRWLSEVDNECVCDLLVRLPSFLSRPIHQYTVVVDESCNVTYSCGSRLQA